MTNAQIAVRIREIANQMKADFTPAQEGPTARPAMLPRKGLRVALHDLEALAIELSPGPVVLNSVEYGSIRDQIESYGPEMFRLDEETSTDSGFAVQDMRDEIGDGLVTWVNSQESLDFLVKHGAEIHLSSPFNGC